MIRRRRPGASSPATESLTPPSLAAGLVPPRLRVRLARLAGGLSLVLFGLVLALAAYSWWYGQGIVEELQAGDKAQVVADARPYLGSQPSDVALVAPESKGKVTTFLLIGSDSRDSGRGNSDTMILARLDQTNETLSLLSIPRDLKVPIPHHTPFKINAAYALGGVPLTIETIRDYFGVRIDHFVMVDFAGFQGLVDQVGGVYISVDRRYYNHNDGSYDSNYADIDLRPGYQLLGGADALSFVRFRHEDSDLYRVARQQQFLRELKRQIGSRRNLDLPPLLKTAAKSMTSDISSLSSLLGYVNSLRDMPSDRVVRVSLPTTSEVGVDGRNYLYATSEAVSQAMARWRDPLLGDRTGMPASEKESAGQGAYAHSEPVTQTGDDGSQARRLLSAAAPKGLDYCAPNRRVAASGYDSEPTNSYRLHSRPALALSTRIADGRSYLWTFTSWQSPPILAQPSEERTRNGRDYRLYWEAGDLRAVAFQHGSSQVWLTNTLRNDLSPQVMLEIASSCR